MREYILNVTESNYLQSWILFVNNSLNIDCSSFDVLIVNFRNRAFLETDDLVLLACLVEHFHIEGKSIEFKGGTAILNAHLDRIKFKNYWKTGFSRDKFTFTTNQTTFCLWKISKSMISSYSTFAKDYFSRTNFKGKDMGPLASNLDEVFNNIFDHSKSPVNGYIITQFFPKNKVLSFSVCDLGVGIPYSINRYLESQGELGLKDEDAILKSLEQGFTVKSTPRNRGFGLNNILELTESSNGLLRITSNTGHVEKPAGKKYESLGLGVYLRGTLVRVDVDTKTFEELEDSVEEFGF
jgi:anti-sigma regulatory factor (Ser/Thr protein kinase)